MTVLTNGGATEQDEGRSDVGEPVVESEPTELEQTQQLSHDDCDVGFISLVFA